MHITQHSTEQELKYQVDRALVNMN